MMLPAFLLMGWLNHLVPWSGLISRLAVVVLSIFTGCFAVFHAPAPGASYLMAQKLIPILRSIQEKEHIEAGLSDYWYANLITFLSHDEIQLRAVTGNGSIFHWLNNLAWYAGDGKSLHAPEFRMILMPSLNADHIRQRYGEPARVITAMPGMDLWIYPVEKSITYHAFIGELSNTNGSSTNEFRAAASALPTLTGKVEGNSLVVKEGRDKEGYINFGPYIRPVSGRYRIVVTFAYLTKPDPSKPLSWDMVLWTGNQPAVTDYTTIPYVDGPPGEFVRDVKISNPTKGTIESRIFYRGSGDVRIDSLRIIYLGP
jgi:hypothetical protein